MIQRSIGSLSFLDGSVISSVPTCVITMFSSTDLHGLTRVYLYDRLFLL
jgi:hypothetical protein